MVWVPLWMAYTAMGIEVLVKIRLVLGSGISTSPLPSPSREVTAQRSSLLTTWAIGPSARREKEILSSVERAKPQS